MTADQPAITAFWHRMAQWPVLRYYFTINLPAADISTRRRVVVVNAVAFLAVFYSCFYSLLYASQGWWLAAGVGFLSAALYVVIPALNHAGHNRLASMTISLMGLFWLSVLPGIFVGRETGIHYFLFFIGPFVYLALDQRDRKWAILLVPIGLLGMLTVQLDLWPNQWVQAMPPEWHRFFYLMSVSMTMLLITLMVVVFIQQLRATQAQLEAEHEEVQRLLLNILPEAISTRLRSSHDIIADQHAGASVLFADIVGFTELADKISPSDLVGKLNRYFSAFDDLVAQHGAEKIKTIGDAYMVASGVPLACEDHAGVIVRLALDMLSETQRINAEGGDSLQLRIGINSGPVVAGVMGKHKFVYDLWGDTVNVASRMESHGVPGRVHITDHTFRLICGDYDVAPRGDIAVKGKGRVRTWLIVSAGDTGMATFGQAAEPSIQWFPGRRQAPEPSD